MTTEPLSPSGQSLLLKFIRENGITLMNYTDEKGMWWVAKGKNAKGAKVTAQVRHPLEAVRGVCKMLGILCEL